MTVLDLTPENAGCDLSGAKNSWMGTYTGKRFYPFNPKAEDISIEDIAHALSNSTRFGGHMDQFYSVAQHSYLGVSFMVAHGVESKVQKQFLLHDATEAYIGDMVRPMKIYFPEFKHIEDAIWEVIADKFNVDVNFDLLVKEVDNIMCMWEKRDLLPRSEPWSNMPDISRYDLFKISCHDPSKAKKEFLKEFARLF